MSAFRAKVELLYGWLVRIGNFLQTPFLLLIRLYWGWLFLQSGFGKLTHLDKTVAYFTSLNIPAPALNAYFNATLETVGGILLILGLASRLIAIPLLINMIMAYVIADREALTSFLSEDPGKFYAADPFPFLLVSLLIFVFGPGMLSLDHLITWKRRKATPTSAAAT